MRGQQVKSAQDVPDQHNDDPMFEPEELNDRKYLAYYAE